MTQVLRHLPRSFAIALLFVLSLAPATGVMGLNKRGVHGRALRVLPRRSAAAAHKVSSRNSRQFSVNDRRRAAGERAVAARRRRAEAQRQAAIARQRALDNAIRSEVQSLIARDDLRGEDPEVRRIAVNALGNHAGTVVVMDPKTGRIYTIVNQDWALRRGFKPCSTIKLVTGVAGLNEGVIDKSDTAKVSGAYRMNLTDALAYSNNTYFQQVGGRVGFDKMLSYATLFGLGQKTGINTPNEIAGALPLFKSGAAVNHMSSHGDNFQVTAVQLATLVSAMANGGKLLSPYVPRTAHEEAQLSSRVRRQIQIDRDSFTRMIPGMVGAVNYGSGRRAHNSEETVAGKTGTCIGENGWVGLFTSYAPLADPRLAVVVIARGTDAHGHFPAAVAGQIYRALSYRFGTPTNFQVASGAQSPDVKADPKAAFDEEESEAEGDTEESDADAITVRTAVANGNSSGATKILTPNRSAASGGASNSNVKRVLMQIPVNQRPAAKRTSTTSVTETIERSRRVNSQRH